ncbi:inner membrane zinc metalloprotease [Spiroplasma sabaudiense Ar-1343]|uniref:Inner membrane zinc metalloprotease n=1 Tax=Spiroplasma sabaudiense Ar-1343 TaxID=1276257 RepID=W6AAE7_9MOLU|nr:site-2 protease family protein [Spiroplasma sabaudiense]AHI53981.1 inner membrane zinc metalloprotease [Spiroplasma sabaudiense Ar-1343]
MPAWLEIIFGLVLGLIVLQIVITLHELGHFLIAKICKAYVYEFSVGLGPKIFTIKGKETWFTMRWIPFGGYCSIASDRADPPVGREEEEKNIPDARKMDYIARWKRFFIILGGIAVNLFLALFLITTIYAATGVKKNDMQFYGANYDENKIAYNLLKSSPQVEEVNQQYVIWGWQVIQQNYNADATQPVSPENDESTVILFNNIDRAAFENDDFLKLSSDIPSKLLINDFKSNHAVTYEKTVYNFVNNLNFKDVNNESTTYIRFAFKKVDRYNGAVQQISSPKAVNEEHNLVLTDWSESYDPAKLKELQLDSNFSKSHFAPGDSVGIAPPNRYFKSAGAGYAFGWQDTFVQSWQIMKAFGKMFTFDFSGVASPFQTANQSLLNFTAGPASFFLYIAFISANLFVLNLIPIPPLDGYRVLENFIELCIRREISDKFKILISVIGILLFLMIFIFVIFKDFL